MEFRFVNHSPGGSNNRKIIRSHVMKGKNSGKTHVSRGQTRRKQGARDEPVLPSRDMITTLRRMISVPSARPFLHVSLSMTAAWLDFFEYKEHESPAAIAHMTQAFALVNQRLSNPEGTSDQTIALICMLVCQESIRGDLERYKTHLLGLARIVELRGGIHVLEEKDDVIHKICR
ncbi:hypothetical protein LY78DRAFT_702363 [Colletotrichum sublineola]|nr:hypothetical protein LY78DRAFT_702363 [Colletotrichum sublineola]